MGSFATVKKGEETQRTWQRLRASHTQAPAHICFRSSINSRAGRERVGTRGAVGGGVCLRRRGARQPLIIWAAPL